MTRYFWLFLFWGASLVVLAGCRTSQTLSPSHASASDSASVNYSLIYVIHADANYLYHDNNGNPHQANLDVLQEAMNIGRKATHGEVFIFHQAAEQKALWIFPKKDRLFLHYKNGRLLQKKRYSPHSKTKSFVTEAKLYRAYHQTMSQGDEKKRIFLYFGHEIPYQQTISYFHSRPDARFNITTFAQGLQSFTVNKKPFDLAVLSTCNNGSPSMVSQLQPLTHYLIASPENLHLSNIDTDSLLMLENKPNTPTLTLAKSIASQTVSRLKKEISTVITLSIYDMDEINSYIGHLSEKYQAYRKSHGPLDLNKDNVDCAEFSFFDPAQFEEGIFSYYRPPVFGRKHARSSFSGWGCRE